MNYTTHIENPDIILVGSGVMSANLAALLKRLQPTLKIQVYEVTSDLAQESSHGWNNAGTGHAGICELSYTPHREADGTVNVANAIKIFEQFERTKQFWSYALASGMIDRPTEFINPVQHLSFVHGEAQVAYLKARHAGLAAHHFSRASSLAPTARRSVHGHPSSPRAAPRVPSPRPKWTAAPT
jgi:malate dehydrogenase (quinone)